MICLSCGMIHDKQYSNISESLLNASYILDDKLIFHMTERESVSISVICEFDVLLSFLLR